MADFSNTNEKRRFHPPVEMRWLGLGGVLGTIEEIFHVSKYATIDWEFAALLAGFLALWLLLAIRLRLDIDGLGFIRRDIRTERLSFESVTEIRVMGTLERPKRVIVRGINAAGDAISIPLSYFVRGERLRRTLEQVLAQSTNANLEVGELSPKKRDELRAARRASRRN